MRPNFEFIESHPNPLLPALQLAQDALAQTRAYHQNLQTRQQQLADATPPPLTYAGQSQGQPLLRTPEGNLLRAGQRDSNGGLLPGAADIVSSNGVVRVGGMPRIRPTAEDDTEQTATIAVLIERQNTDGSRDVFIKEGSYTLFALPRFEPPVNGMTSTSVIGTRAFSYYDKGTLIVQTLLKYSTSPDITSNQVSLIKQQGLVLSSESSQVDSDEDYAFASELRRYLPMLKPSSAEAPSVHDSYGFNEFATSASVQADGSIISVFSEGEATATFNVETYFNNLLNGYRFGCARGFTEEISVRKFPARQSIQINQADLVVMGLSYDSLIRPGSSVATPVTIAAYKANGPIVTRWFDEDDAEYNILFARGYTDARI